MVKYLRIAINTLQEYFVYRINFIFWRLQVFITFVIFFSLWSSVSVGRDSLGSYSLPQLYSYFVIGYIVRAFVFTTRTADIGGDIQNGNLSSLIIKPIGTIKYYFSRDVVDKFFNLFFMFWELLLIFFIFRPSVAIPSLSNFILFVLFLLLSVIIFFFYSLIISFLTFWSDNAWSSRFLFGIVFVTLFSGQYVPLDFLPPFISRIIDYTPYPYMYYYPVKVWLGQLPLFITFQLIFRSLFFALLCFLVASFLWQKGKQKYQSYGN